MRTTSSDRDSSLNTISGDALREVDVYSMRARVNEAAVEPIAHARVDSFRPYARETRVENAYEEVFVKPLFYILACTV